MIRVERASKIYRTKHADVHALDRISLHVKKGEFVVVRGPSGSGKTTLLLSIGGMLRPTEGRITVNDSDIYAMSKRKRALFRANHIGFVFQLFHLVPYLNAIENVLLPAGVGQHRYSPEDVRQLLNRLNLTERMYHTPSELSAGERQRTAMARAILKQPRIILADEPTGNLDPKNSEEIIGYLVEFHRKGGTVVVVTHGESADRFADRVVRLDKGHID